MSKTIGPILTPDDFIPGSPTDVRGDQSTTFDGDKGYPKGSGGKLPEVTYVDTDGFSSPKPSGR